MAKKNRCRDIAPSGMQCPAVAVRGQKYCYRHRKFRDRACSAGRASAAAAASQPTEPVVFTELDRAMGLDRAAAAEREAADRDAAGRLTIPLIEDRATLQMTISQVLQALAEDRISPMKAKTLLYGLQVAAQNLTRMVAERNMDRPAEGRVAPEPVEDFEQTSDGEELGPETEYQGPHGKRRRVWSIEKMLYNGRLKEQGKPEIEFEDDFPEEGYLTEEEQIASLKKHAEILGPGRAHLLGPIED